MKKSLVALAALAVVGAASAQSTVTLYGIVDMGVSALRDTNSTATPSTELNKNGMKSVLSGSRLGFKGTEDLGGGLNANFLLELGITPDEATFSGLLNRQSYVGLTGGFGGVTLGRQYTPYFNVQAAMDLYGNIDAPGYIVALHNRARASNAVTYSTPNFGGFAGAFQIASGEAAVAPGAQASGNSFGLSAVYAKGPLVAGIGYDSVTNPQAAFAGLTQITNGADVYRFGGTTSSDVNVWAAGASYDFTVVKASLAYSALTDNQNATAANTNAKSSKGWNLSVAAPFGAVTVIGNLGRGNITQTAAGSGDLTYTGYQLGANYSLSKRTTAYAVYGYDDVTAAAVTGDITRRQASVGIKHTF